MFCTGHKFAIPFEKFFIVPKEKALMDWSQGSLLFSNDEVDRIGAPLYTSSYILYPDFTGAIQILILLTLPTDNHCIFASTCSVTTPNCQTYWHFIGRWRLIQVTAPFLLYFANVPNKTDNSHFRILSILLKIR